MPPASTCVGYGLWTLSICSQSDFSLQQKFSFRASALMRILMSEELSQWFGFAVCVKVSILIACTYPLNHLALYQDGITVLLMLLS